MEKIYVNLNLIPNFLLDKIKLMFNVLNFDLKNNFNTFRKLFYNNLNNHYVKLFQIFPNIDSWLKTYNLC